MKMRRESTTYITLSAAVSCITRCWMLDFRQCRTSLGTIRLTWTQEINSKGVRCVAFSFQTVGTGLRASNLYVHYLAAFKYLTERIPAETEIIVAGMVSSKRVQFLKDVCSNPLSVLNQSAYVHEQEQRNYCRKNLRDRSN